MTDPNNPYVMMTPKGSARIVATDGQNVTLHAGFVSPPGSPLSGMLDGTAHQLQVKVHGCRRITASATEPNATSAAEPPVEIEFEIVGRWVSLSREARCLLLREST